MAEAESMVFGITRKSLEARIIFACSICRAPGAYSDAEPIKQGWPGCYDAERAGQPVGNKCPNCGGLRPDDLDKGELKASIPMWLWKAIAGAKWLFVRLIKLKRKLKTGD